MVLFELTATSVERPANNVFVLVNTLLDVLIGNRKVDIRLHGKGNSKLPWRKAGQPRHLVDVVDADQ